MFNVPVYVAIDYHTHTLQVCIMDSQRKILANQSVANDPETVFNLIAIYGNNVHVAKKRRQTTAESAATPPVFFCCRLLSAVCRLILARPKKHSRTARPCTSSTWTCPTTHASQTPTARLVTATSHHLS